MGESFLPVLNHIFAGEPETHLCPPDYVSYQDGGRPSRNRGIEETARGPEPYGSGPPACRNRQRCHFSKKDSMAEGTRFPAK